MSKAGLTQAWEAETVELGSQREPAERPARKERSRRPGAHLAAILGVAVVPILVGSFLAVRQTSDANYKKNPAAAQEKHASMTPVTPLARQRSRTSTQRQRDSISRQPNGKHPAAPSPTATPRIPEVSPQTYQPNPAPVTEPPSAPIPETEVPPPPTRPTPATVEFGL